MCSNSVSLVVLVFESEIMLPICKSKFVQNRKKKYRHSTTFYRKLKVMVNDINDNSGIKQPDVLKQLPSASSSITPNNLQQEQVVIRKENYPETSEERNGNQLDESDDSFCLSEDGTFPSANIEPCDEQDPVNSQITLSEELIAWYHSHRISRNALDHILKIFKSHTSVNLPSDSRTLLKTPREVHLQAMGNGQFWYNGVKNCLGSVFSEIDKSLTLPLVFNVDGIPPFNASTIEFWPILCRIENMPHLKPMAISIYCGETKPPLKEFFEQFVEEVNDILQNGFYINGYQLKIDIKYFVCDTPARNFIKGTVGFNAAHGCIKCTVVGEFDKKARHMSFPRIDSPLRTNESFRNKSDPDHHKDDSPLVKLPIDMVEDIIIADSLHLFDLGIMRKCLYGWVNGSYNFKTKLSATEINLLSDMLDDCNVRRPAEIHRAVRRLKCLKFWKGSEYRTFLLYLGCVVLKDFLCAEAYNNFITLFCAVTIISCKTYLKYIDIADCLLKDYVEQFIDIYGIDSISSNVHNAIHVINDVKKFGNLSEISTYPFENFLGHLKYLVRTGNRPLAQIAKRVRELSVFNTNKNFKNVTESTPYVKNENRTEKNLHGGQIFNDVYICDNFMLSNNIKNKWFLTKKNEIISMIYATHWEKAIHIYGGKIKVKSDFFEFPVKSSHLNIYKSDGRTILPTLYSLKDIKCKLISLKYKQEFVFIPLIHTLDVDTEIL